jgi:hypothetical protein
MAAKHANIRRLWSQLFVVAVVVHDYDDDDDDDGSDNNQQQSKEFSSHTAHIRDALQYTCNII